MEGTAFGRYRVTGKIAQGSMGVVYAAVHELMHLEAVVKVLQPEMSVDKSIVERFFDEAQDTARIRHPGIVAIFDLGYSEDDRAYLVMERLRGETLHDRLQRLGRLPVEQALAVVRQLLGALGAAHERGIVHRSLKPENVFIVPDPEAPDDEQVKVLDFGLAELANPINPSEVQGGLRISTDVVSGTPSYMAPEQCTGAAEVDQRADLYAVGCLLYACLCGAPPFTGAGADILAAHLRLAPTPLRELRPDVPPYVDELVMRLLQKRPEDRPATCAEVAGALDGAQDHQEEMSAGSFERADTVHDETTAVPVFQEPERCEIIDERGGGENAAHVGPAALQGGARHTIPGVPFHFRPPGPCRHRGAGEQALAGRAAAPARHQERADTRVDQAPATWSPPAPTAHVDDCWGSPPLGQPALAPSTQTSSARPDSQCTIETSAAQMYRPERSEVRRRHIRASAVALAVLVALGYGLAALQSASDTGPALRASAIGAEAETETEAEAETAAEVAMGGGGRDEATGHGSQECLAQAREAMDNAQWDRAMAFARQARTMARDEPLRVHAAAIEDLARRERQHEERFEQLRTAVTTGDMASAAAHLAEIPESSTYRAQAIELTRAVWIAEQTREAEAHVAAGRCDQVAGIAERVGYVSAEAGTVMDEMHAACVPAKGEEDRASASEHDGTAPEDARTRTPEELARDARRAYQAQRYRSAHRLCRKALGLRPDDQRLVALCGMSACRTGRSALAKRYYEKASTRRKAQIARTCQRSGIRVARASTL